MTDRNVPDINFLGVGGNLNQQRFDQMNAPSNQPLPICKFVEEGKLGALISADTEEEPDLGRVIATDINRYLSSRGIRPNFLRVRLDRALLSGHHQYEELVQMQNQPAADAMEVARLIKTANRIPNICCDIIKHPYILEPLVMVGPNRKLEKVTHILYEDVPLGTLNRAVEQEYGPFEDITAMQLAFQLAKALRYCHEDLKILHRNINPKSIFVFQDPNGRFYLKLGGFVFARRISKEDALSANPNIMFRFTAPEALEDNSDIAFYNYSSDVWSFGMVIDFIAHDGRDPFPGLNKIQLKKALLEPRRPALRSEPPLHSDLVELIESCLRAETREENGQIGPLKPLRPTAAQICAFFEGKGYTA